MKAKSLQFPLWFFTITAIAAASNTIYAQVHTCPVMVSRNNGNGGSNSCPGSGMLVATSVNSTSFSFVPSGNKTADITLKGGNTDPWYTDPPAIYAVYTTSSGTSTAINTYPGPPGAPVSGNIKYCSYTGTSGNGNMPNAGIVSIRFVTPTNISDYLVCSYDFSNSNALVANPATIVTLPVHFYSFDAVVINRSVNLTWTASRDKNASRFIAERSVNGVDFTELFSTPAITEGANDIASYSYNDFSVGEINAYRLYYRIKEVDQNGAFTYSQVNTVKLGDEGNILSMAVFGNSLVIKSADGTGTLQYMSIDGRIMKEEKIVLNNGITTLPVNSFIGNLSVVRLIANGQVVVCRV